MISFIVALFNLLVIKDTNLMYCDIKGNVKNPGVYEIIEGEVVNDIILKAGGLKKNSYVKNINLSKKVEDQMVINILSIDEYEDLTYQCPVCSCEEMVICKEKITTTLTSKNIQKQTTFVTSKVSETTTKRMVIDSTTKLINKETTTIQEVVINLNDATLEELMKLPGIGEVLAKRIVEYRNGKLFETIEELKEVKGIGNVLFEKVKKHIII